MPISRPETCRRYRRRWSGLASMPEERHRRGLHFVTTPPERRSSFYPARIEHRAAHPSTDLSMNGLGYRGAEYIMSTSVT